MKAGRPRKIDPEAARAIVATGARLEHTMLRQKLVANLERRRAAAAELIAARQELEQLLKHAQTMAHRMEIGALAKAAGVRRERVSEFFRGLRDFTPLLMDEERGDTNE